MRRIINRILLIQSVILLVITHDSAHGLSPELNYPRIGDEMTVRELGNVPSFDRNKRLTDLSGAVITGSSRFRVYRPAREDSLSCMVIVHGKRTSSIVSRGGVLLESGYSQPGESRIYAGGIPYEACAPDSLTAHDVCSRGNISGTGEFMSGGKKIIRRRSGRQIITPDADTVGNLDYVETVIDEMFIYAGSDTARHCGTHARWYAGGYRYPVLTYTDDYIVSMENDTVDRVQRWEAAFPDIQEDEITDDPMNELVRNILADSKEKSRTEKGRRNPASGSRRFGDFEWNPASEEISLSPGISRESLSEYILCDISGRVYSAGRLDSAGCFSVSLSACPPGVYVFGYDTDDGFNSFKITKL